MIVVLQAGIVNRTFLREMKKVRMSWKLSI
jgi:hypothetical protein